MAEDRSTDSSGRIKAALAWCEESLAMCAKIDGNLNKIQGELDCAVDLAHLGAIEKILQAKDSPVVSRDTDNADSGAKGAKIEQARFVS